MANHTKRIILEEFQCMLKEMPFDKITVSALVKRCEISPNTFYYHYQDFFSLLDDWLVQWLESIYRAVESNVDCRPNAIIRRFDLQKPVFSTISCYGHFGSNASDMPWEKTDLKLSV